MTRFPLALGAATLLALPAAAQTSPHPAMPRSAPSVPTTTDTTTARYQAFDATGGALPLPLLLDEAARADVVFLGEIHDDPTGHAVELAVLAGIVERAGSRPVVLALEMFEADVQTVLDEYVAGIISERDFLEASRPWQNYADYRPLVEFARTHGVRVVASNAPVRYVRVLARGEALGKLSEAALATLPPFPVAPASEATAAAFAEAMGGMGGHGGSALLDAQNLRDASMAHQTARALGGPGRPLVVHVNGGFHTAGRRGIPEHLTRLAPAARVFVVAIEPVADVDARPEAAGADAVVQTEARLVPSRNR